MNRGRLIWRSLIFFRASHLAAAAGIAVAAAVIAGALIVGDSVRGTLRAKALERAAGAHYAITSGDGFFRQELSAIHPSAMPVLILSGAARHSEKPTRANDVQIVGITRKYFSLSGLEGPPLAADHALLSPELAAQLGAVAGEEIVLRMRAPSELAGEAAIAPGKMATVGWRVRVAGVLDARHGGGLNLRGSGLETHNVFVPIESVATEVQRPGKANVLLLGSPVRGAEPLSIEEINRGLSRVWKLEDAGLGITSHPDGSLSVESSRIFLPASVVRAVEKTSSNSVALLTYLANVIVHRTNATPYSMVTAAGPPYMPPGMKDDEIILSEWLAEDLDARQGDAVQLSYYLPDSGARLRQATNYFTVRGIVPMAAPHADRSLMPDFPGIKEAERTHDWDAGFPLQYEIRDKDEAYWKEHRGTPKAFITYAAGQQLWSNRFGVATSIRLMGNGNSAEKLKAALVEEITPPMAGISVRDLNKEAVTSVNNAQDFGQLFIAFSVFIIVSALLLIWLLLQFALESRADEAGAMFAVGFSPGLIRRLYAGESLLVALAGTLMGTAAGAVYAKALLWGLGTAWRNAVGGAVLDLHLHATSLVLGGVISLVLSAIVVWMVVRNGSRRATRELLAGEIEVVKRGASTGASGLLALICLVAALGMFGFGFYTREPAPGTFFGAGALFLCAGWAAFWRGQRLRRRDVAFQSWRGLVLQTGARKPRRSLAAVALISCGVFVIVAVSGFRLPDAEGNRQRTAGTGGFDFIGATSLPIVQDLTLAEGREGLGITSPPDQMLIVPFRVKDGDEASCLNLSRAVRPRVLGVDPDRLAGRFRFASPGGASTRPWNQLREVKTAADGVLEVTAIGDANSVRWSMGKGLGQTIDIEDESGRVVRLRIVATLENSILQGSLVISETAFLQIFPQTAGYRFFLVESGGKGSGDLAMALEDFGFEAVSAKQRLSSLSAVQNTYISTFQFLGAIGLLVGSAGLGLLVLRNVLERRGELAVMMATGFARRRLMRLVLEENLLLLFAGLLIGVVSALAAVAPAMDRGGVSWVMLAGALGAVMLNGVAWTIGASALAMRGAILAALRKE